MMFAVLLVAALGAVAINADATPSAPVVILGSANQYNQANAIHQYSGEELTNILDGVHKGDAPTVVFHVPSLAPIDLKTNKKSLSGLQSLISIYLPNVAAPVTSLLAHAGPSAILTSGSAGASQLIATIDAAAPGAYVFVELSPSAEDDSPAATLQRHDALIQNVVASVQNKNVLFVFTGEPLRSRVARQAPAPIEVPATPPKTDNKQTVPTGTVEGTSFTHSNVLIYFKNLTLADAKIDITSITVGDVVTTSDGQSVAVELVAATPADSVSFNLTGASGYWNVDAFSFRGVQLRPLEFKVEALDEFSFHCTPSLAFQEVTTGAMSQLHLEGLQLEPIFEAGSNRTAFSDPWDCVGFTSAGIWGGLFVTFLMLIILSIGISWIMDIHTMDRFDDPKGKTIIVSASD